MKNKLCVAAVFIAAASCVAQADTIYTSQAAFDAAVSGVTSVNFEGIVGTDSYAAFGGSPPARLWAV